MIFLFRASRIRSRLMTARTPPSKTSALDNLCFGLPVLPRFQASITTRSRRPRMSAMVWALQEGHALWIFGGGVGGLSAGLLAAYWARRARRVSARRRFLLSRRSSASALLGASSADDTPIRRAPDRLARVINRARPTVRSGCASRSRAEPSLQAEEQAEEQAESGVRAFAAKVPSSRALLLRSAARISLLRDGGFSSVGPSSPSIAEGATDWMAAVRKGSSLRSKALGR
mmetsp:Transcript_46259/g.104464  ORF Transcript_46259/g.104464 Transcript_46259/m.104464 type:complete len:230 (+) Transcript_46259:625-1314(+)